MRTNEMDLSPDLQNDLLPLMRKIWALAEKKAALSQNEQENKCKNPILITPNTTKVE